MKFTSQFLAINKGVPQGSVIPAFHIVFFTNMLASLQYRAHWLNDGITIYHLIVKMCQSILLFMTKTIYHGTYSRCFLFFSSDVLQQQDDVFFALMLNMIAYTE